MKIKMQRAMKVTCCSEFTEKVTWLWKVGVCSPNSSSPNFFTDFIVCQYAGRSLSKSQHNLKYILGCYQQTPLNSGERTQLIDCTFKRISGCDADSTDGARLKFLLTWCGLRNVHSSNLCLHMTC